MTEAGAGGAHRRGRADRRSPVAMLRRLRFTDPGLVALRNAARAAIVMPSVFAVADKVIGDPQVSLFASFGSFAILVFADFAGPPARRLTAYLGLTCVGAAFIIAGTLCSQGALLATAGMAVAGFLTLFSGAINPYFAAGTSAAVLLFVLPATIPAPPSAIPARLDGWLLAAAAGIAAQLLLWPGRRRATLRKDAARACAALADLADAQLSGSSAGVAESAEAARKAVDRLRQGFVALPHRPNGLIGATTALGSLVDESEWLLYFLASPDGRHRLPLCEEENAAAIRASADALRASATVLDGGPSRPPDLTTLDGARDAMTRALAGRLPDLPAVPDHEALVSAALEPTFRARAISYAAQNCARYALLADGAGESATGHEPPPRLARWRRPGAIVARMAVEDTDSRSIWFRNSVRGAVGLALAVYIAQRTGLQHSFWVVLGTFSVLRSNALGTGRTVLSAVAGTGIGIVAGALLVAAVGTHPLWAVLPVAVLLAAYAPRAISFAAGQAAFNVVLFVLFNIIQPSGWRIGLVRIEDAGIGFAISLGVGLLFWPRGAARLLRENLAAAYARAADDVLAATRRVIGRGDPDWAERAAQDADAAVHRLDDAFRQYLTERSAHPVDVDSVAALVTGAARLRRVGRSLEHLSVMIADHPVAESSGANLDAEVHALRSWYIALGDCLIHGTDVPPPHIRDDAGRRRLLADVHRAVATRDEGAVRAAIALLWADQYLDTLWRMEAHLRRHALAATAAPVAATAAA